MYEVVDVLEGDEPEVIARCDKFDIAVFIAEGRRALYRKAFGRMKSEQGVLVRAARVVTGGEGG